MELPRIGERVTVYPAPLPRHPEDDGEPILRRVSDGPGADGSLARLLPAEGGERLFDYYWHDRLVAGDVVRTDPREHYAHAERGEPKADQATATAAPPTAKATPPAPLRAPVSTVKE